MEEDIDGDMEDIETLNYDDLDNVSKLQKTQRYTDIMQVSSYIIFASILHQCDNLNILFICYYYYEILMLFYVDCGEH